MAKPEIRIKGFDEEWTKSSIGDLGNWHKGRLLAKSDISENGKYACIHYGELFTQYGAVIDEVISKTDVNTESFSKVGDLLFPDSDVTPTGLARCSALMKENVILGGGINVLRLQKGLSAPFISYSINREKRQIIDRVTGTMVKHINSKSLSEVVIGVTPKKDEQERIAEYLELLDSNIRITEKKLASIKQLKKACLISMFPLPGEKTPRVRVKGFTGDWETEKLGSIATRITRKNTKLETRLPLTISSLDGLIEQTMFFNNVVASVNLSGYYLIKRGEFAYNKSYSNGFPFGSVKRLEKFDKGALSTLYIVFSLNNNIASDYIVSFFETCLWHREVSKRAAEGARNHGLLNISADDFLDIDILIPPTIDEQQKVADFLKTIDLQIMIQSQRLEKLKQIKSACLDKMFV